MALTRKYLKSIGLNEDQIDGVIEEHTSVTEALKEQIKTYKADADKLPGVQKELDDLKAAGDGGYKEKYEAEAQAHSTLKQQIATEKANAAKRTAMDDFLTNKVGIHRESARTLILDAVKWDDIKLDDSGALAGADELAKAYGAKYADFVGAPGEKGVPPTTPPSGGQGGGGLTRKDIYKKDEKGRYVYSSAQRQQMIMDNPDAFKK